MSIIKQTDWVPPDNTTFPTLQRLRQNPDGPYRELLMAEDPNSGEPIPYNVPTGTAVRIPHAMSLGSLGVDGQAASASDARIPDVVIPVMVTDTVLGPPDGIVSLIWDAIGALGPNGSSTGMWVDEDYVYLYVGGGQGLTASVVVYVEYTHSIIRNEIVTGEYYPLSAGLGGGQAVVGGLVIP